jgi:hypothetical protein
VGGAEWIAPFNGSGNGDKMTQNIRIPTNICKERADSSDFIFSRSTLSLDLVVDGECKAFAAVTFNLRSPSNLRVAVAPTESVHGKVSEGDGVMVSRTDWRRFDPVRDTPHFEDETWALDPGRWHEWWGVGSAAAARHVFLNDGDTDAGGGAPCESIDIGGGDGGTIVEDLSFPAYVMSLPSRSDRRRHMRQLARALGFSDVRFPRTTPAAQVSPRAPSAHL